EFYVDEHNRVLPHSAFLGQTPDEMYFGTGDTVPADLMTRAAAARRARVKANRSAGGATCPAGEAAAGTATADDRNRRPVRLDVTACSEQIVNAQGFDDSRPADPRFGGRPCMNRENSRGKFQNVHECSSA